MPDAPRPRSSSTGCAPPRPGSPAPRPPPAGTSPSALLTGIDAIEDQVGEPGRRITEARARHPDAPIVTGLPSAGQIRAAALLAEIGDARGRYPDPQTPAAAAAAAAGVCPFTDASGKHRAVGFRYKVDTKLRRAITDFAETPATPTTGPPTSTAAPAPAACATRTPFAFSLAPGPP